MLLEFGHCIMRLEIMYTLDSSFVKIASVFRQQLVSLKSFMQNNVCHAR